MDEIAVIDNPRAAEVALDSVRLQLLAALSEPAAAATLARRLGLPRQKVNYHLKSLESHGLVAQVDERRKGNVMERVMCATAQSYVISPQVLSGVEPQPGPTPERLSARWLLALASRLLREVAQLVTGAARERKRVAAFGMDGQIRFASAADRAAFANELTDTVTRLVSKYHTEGASAGRDHRVLVALHAVPPSEKEEK